MNKEDSLYIKKKFGAKVLAVLKRLVGSDSPEGGSGGEGTLTVVIRQIDNVTITVDKNASEVVNALIAGKSVFYIYKGSNETRTTSFILVDGGLYPDSRIGVVFLDSLLDGDTFWKSFTHQGDTITFN